MGSWHREAGRSETEAALEAGIAFDAVVAGNDLLALGAMAALHARGLSVPEDVAVAGWDDIPEAAWSRPGLTTIAPDLDALIAAALDAALAEADDSSAGGAETVVGHQLLVRGSSVPA